MCPVAPTSLKTDATACFKAFLLYNPPALSWNNALIPFEVGKEMRPTQNRKDSGKTANQSPQYLFLRYLLHFHTNKFWNIEIYYIYT